MIYIRSTNHHNLSVIIQQLKSDKEHFLTSMTTIKPDNLRKIGVKYFFVPIKGSSLRIDEVLYKRDLCSRNSVEPR